MSDKPLVRRYTIGGAEQRFASNQEFFYWLRTCVDVLNKIRNESQVVVSGIDSEKIHAFIDRSIRFFEASSEYMKLKSANKKAFIGEFEMEIEYTLNNSTAIVDPGLFIGKFGEKKGLEVDLVVPEIHDSIKNIKKSDVVRFDEFFGSVPGALKPRYKSVLERALNFDSVSDTVSERERIDARVKETAISVFDGLADPEKLIAERETAEKLLKEARSKWTELEKEAAASRKDRKAEFEAADTELREVLNSRCSELAESLADLFSRTEELKSSVSDAVAFAEQSFESFEESAKIRSAKHEETMDGMEAAFRARLELEAPAQLWDEKSVHHKEAASSRIKVAVAVTSLFGAVVLIGLLLVIRIDLFAVTKTPDLALTLLLAVPLVCGFVIIRVLFRMYNLSQALADDSEHRSALMKSFLALSTETGGGLKDEERLIVLSALFRPTDLSGAQDSAQVHHLFEVAAKRVVGTERSSGG